MAGEGESGNHDGDRSQPNGDSSPPSDHGNVNGNPTPSTPDSPTSTGFNTDQLPLNTSQNFSEDDDDGEASVDPYIVRDEPEIEEEEEEGEDLFNDNYMDDYRRMDEQDHYESLDLDDSMEDERDLDQIMADRRAAEVELDTRDTRVASSQRKLPQLLHDQDALDLQRKIEVCRQKIATSKSEIVMDEEIDLLQKELKEQLQIESLLKEERSLSLGAVSRSKPSFDIFTNCFNKRENPFFTSSPTSTFVVETSSTSTVAVDDLGADVSRIMSNIQSSLKRSEERARKHRAGLAEEELWGKTLNRMLQEMHSFEEHRNSSTVPAIDQVVLSTNISGSSHPHPHQLRDVIENTIIADDDHRVAVHRPFFLRAFLRGCLRATYYLFFLRGCLRATCVRRYS